MSFSKVGLVGTGIIGEALIEVLLRSGLSKESLSIAEKREERRDEIITRFGVSKINDYGSLDAILLAVKPQDFMETLETISNSLSSSALIVSFAAGIKIESIEEKLGKGSRVIRVMPNTPMIMGRGMSAMSLGSSANTSDQDWVRGFLSQAGEVIVVDESLQDAVTATSGSGPAYFFAFTEAVVGAARRLGISQEDAVTLASQTLIGAALMVEKSGKELKTLRENVTSPNGTTAAALKSFADSGLEELVFQAMQAAHDRSIELSS
jgi:pyrroline-5-carboxylate reductase